jgi:hypothetical protein
MIPNSDAEQRAAAYPYNLERYASDTDGPVTERLVEPAEPLGPGAGADQRPISDPAAESPSDAAVEPEDDDTTETENGTEGSDDSSDRTERMSEDTELSEDDWEPQH